jgi:hypothetical protein
VAVGPRTQWVGQRRSQPYGALLTVGTLVFILFLYAGNSTYAADPHAAFWAQQLRMSALALSPRAADAVSMSNPSVADMGPSTKDGLRLNAMLAAVATGGNRLIVCGLLY